MLTPIGMPLVANLWTVLTLTTLLVIALASIWLTVLAFKRHLWWGLAVLVLPITYPLFAALHWDRARRPFLIGLAAGAALLVELLIASAVQTLLGA